MPGDRDAFRVGVTRDLRQPDGRLAFDPLTLSPLEVEGVRWEFLAEDRRPLTPQLLAGIDGLYHFSTPVGASSLEGADRLSIIARQGVGLDFIDVEECTRRGIAVTITPGAVTRPMASAAATLVLAVAHRLRERDLALHEGDWTVGRFAPLGRGLTGCTLGVIGYGRIGRELVHLLEPWEMRVLVTQRTPIDEDGVSFVLLERLLAEADVVVVACALTVETRGLLDRKRLRQMKRGAHLVNVARGAIVDQEALVEVLLDGHLAGAGLDVVDPEPLPADDALLRLPNVIGAPHSLGYTDQLLSACIESACGALLAVAAGRVPDNLVNEEVLENSVFREKLAGFARRWTTR